MAIKQEAHQKSYWAFISYSSKDEAVARRLHRALEHYRMPRDLVGRPMHDGEPTPKRLFPVFRDRDELPLSADLGNAIESALRASRYLIVLCSPSAATSRWVNEEIRYFKSIGGQDRILAIIASGEPNATDKAGSTGQECFPPALRFHVDETGRLTDQQCEPIAGDLRKGGDGWTACLLKAVAGITGLGLAAFTKRETVRVRRRRILTACAGFLLIGGATAWLDYTRTKVAYYAHLTERFGVPAGAIAVARGDLAGRSSTYRVESSRGKVRRVLHVNGSGFPTEDEDAPFKAAIHELIYREDGSLQTIDFRSRQGHITARREFSLPKETADGVAIIAETKTDHDGAPLSVDTVGEQVTISDKGKSEASVMRSIYGKDGLPVRTEYLNTYRNPAPVSSGVSGTLFEYNNDGLLIRVVFTGIDGLPQTRLDGVRDIRTARNARGYEIERGYFGADGQPILISSGYAILTSKFDDRDNQIEAAFFGTNGELSVNSDGYAKWTSKFDERGNQIEVSFFGADGRPVLSSDGIAKLTAKFDERGNRIERGFFCTKGEPVMHNDGYTKVATKFDERGNRIEVSFFGADGRAVLTRDGYAKWISKFDERGNEVEMSFFGTDGELFANKDGYAKVAAKFDERGNQIEVSFFGADGRPVLSSDGIAKWSSKFDERGNLIEGALFGIDGQPVLSNDGIAKWTSKFDERGNEIEVLYFGTEGQPICNRNGVAKVTARYNDHGFRIERSFFGTNGEPVMHKDGYAKWIAKFDERGEEIEKTYFNLQGQVIEK